MRVRDLTVADEADWRPLWRGYLEFYKSALSEETTADAWRALIEAVYRIADERGCDRVYWHTQETNTVARAPYDRLASKSEFVQYRR